MERADLARLLGASPVSAAPRDVVVEERDPARFIAVFAEAMAAGGTVFVADPSWGQSERTQFQEIIRRASSGGDQDRAGRGWLCLPTGGTSGAIKLARHDGETLAAAVKGFCAHFGTDRVNAIGLLPLHHVSGFMAWIRTVFTGGDYRQADWKAVERGERPELAAGRDGFLSLVPTQLQRLLADPAAVAWLRGFRAVFIGGGPAWPELVEAGARERLPLAFSYGMTETAAMVCALRPEEFLAGGRGCGTMLPHARVTLEAEGRIAVAGGSLFRGYWPEWRETGPWLTEDLGCFDDRGGLRVLGRRDALIITGGKKVDPAEVEAALRATGVFEDLAVIGLPDAEWGEIVVACYPQANAAPDLTGLAARLGVQLAAYKHPKRYLPVAPWPRNAQGKVNRAELRRLVAG
ncbi:MAG: AMP-binding protein [Verrucomicrobia bacterium]|nr:AMP-binding protein [Verrucomicrobiota bacterium]